MACKGRKPAISNEDESESKKRTENRKKLVSKRYKTLLRAVKSENISEMSVFRID